jgi:hypothetical protein
MQLTKEEKTNIFWSLLKEYPEFERSRKQMPLIFKGEEKISKMIKIINDGEKKAYDLIKKFADEIGENIPEYKNPNLRG